MELFKVPDNSKIRVIDPIRVAPGSLESKIGDELLFREIDGMYSICINEDGKVIYLVAWAEVEVIG